MSAMQAGAGIGTNEWFNAGVTNYTAGTSLPSGWNKSADDDSEVAGNDGARYIQLDTAGEVLSYEPGASGAGTNAFVDLSVQFVASDSEPDISGITGPQASLAVQAISGNLTYIAYTNGAWAALSGVSPVTNAFVNVRIEMDYAGENAPRVRYLVGNAGAYTALTANGTEWLPLSDTSVNTRSISNIGFLGSGKVGNFTGYRIVELADIVVSLDGNNTPIVVDSAWLTAHNLSADDPDAINAALAADATNGQKVWKNAVLGLADDVPLYIDSVLSEDSTKMRIGLNVGTSGTSGIAVTYRLEKKNGASWTSVATSENPYFDISLSGDDPSGQYRIIAIFSAAN